MLFRFLLAAVILIGPCLAEDAARMDQVVQSHVADHSFMGSVLVARGNEIIFSKGYGSADLEWDVPNSPNTKFRLGSVTKQFTAASILMLEERGKLSVNDPVKKYMPDAPAAWDKITIMNLLTHTSGIPNFTSFPDYRSQEPFAATPEKLVARFRDKPLDFQDGERDPDPEKDIDLQCSMHRLAPKSIFYSNLTSTVDSGENKLRHTLHDSPPHALPVQSSTSRG